MDSRNLFVLGQCLNFNCTFIVVVMLRQCLTFLRSRGASSFLPIDQNIKFHKMTGQLIFFFGLLHTIMHLINICKFKAFDKVALLKIRFSVEHKLFFASS